LHTFIVVAPNVCGRQCGAAAVQSPSFRHSHVQLRGSVASLHEPPWQITFGV